MAIEIACTVYQKLKFYIMFQKHLIILLCFAFLLIAPRLSAQCPICTPLSPPVPGLADDALYISDLADGVQGDYYEELLTFRMPITTQPICDEYPGFIPEAFCGLGIASVEIVDVVGLPQGVTYTTDQADGIYDLPDEKDGCATICGTPLFPGDYVVTIIVRATVLGISQTTSFEQDMFIAPKISTNDGFTANPATGCAGLTVEFTNNVPSDGSSGITYAWDFGNGLNSNSENPPAQTYAEAGHYIVTYQAVIDTVPLRLAQVNITESDCNDNFGALPDFFIKIFDDNGMLIYTTEATPIENQAPPIELAIDPPLDLTIANYVLQVWDSDPSFLNNDDFCGEVNFTPMATGDLVDGELTVNFTINDFTEIVTSIDTIEVYELPSTPTITGETLFCPDETVTLISSAAEGNQWYLDGNLLSGVTEQIYDADTPGDYSLIVTTPENCTAESQVFSIAHDVPPTPLISVPGGETEVCPGESVTLVSDAANNQWYLDAAPIPNATAQSYEAEEVGIYTVETNSMTGCTVISESVVLMECTTATENPFTENIGLNIYPNPNSGQFAIYFNIEKISDVNLRVRDLTGRVVYVRELNGFSGIFQEEINMKNIAKGLYLMEIETVEGVGYKKVLIR